MPDIKFDGMLFGVPVSREHFEMFEKVRENKGCVHNNGTLRHILQEYKEKVYDHEQ